MTAIGNDIIYDIYLVSGLGLDTRVYDGFEWQNANIIPLAWLEPIQNETIDAYALRLSKFIQPNGRPIVLIGYSFGGLIVQELADLVHVEQVIIISSIKNGDERPSLFKLLRWLPLHHLVSKSIIRLSFPFWADAYGYDTAAKKHLYRDSYPQFSNHYFRWAIEIFVNWKDNDRPIKKLLHIHGTADILLPPSNIKRFLAVPDGKHLMILEKQKAISRLINASLK